MRHKPGNKRKGGQAFLSNGVEIVGLQRCQGCTKTHVNWEVYRGDARKVLEGLPENSFDCVVTSPPYFWQRDYKVTGQIGLERTIEEYVAAIVEVMEQVRRVLKKTGVLFLNLGDTYYSAKGQPKGEDKKTEHADSGFV